MSKGGVGGRLCHRRSVRTVPLCQWGMSEIGLYHHRYVQTVPLCQMGMSEVGLYHHRSVQMYHSVKGDVRLRGMCVPS